MSIKHFFETNLCLSSFNSRFPSKPPHPHLPWVPTGPFLQEEGLTLPYPGTSNYAYWFYSIHLASSIQLKLSIVIFPPGLSDIAQSSLLKF